MKIFLSIVLLLLINYVAIDSREFFGVKAYSENNFDASKIKSIIGKKWKYDYSFSSNVKMKLDSLTDLPMDICFLKSTKKTSIKIGNPIYSMWEKNDFFKTYAIHDPKPFGNISFPIVVNSLKSGNKAKLKIQHYVVSGKKFGKAYDYYISKISDDTIVLNTEKVYMNNGIQSIYNHVYVTDK